MNKLSQTNQTVIIRITQSEQKFFVSIKPFNQENQIFCHKKVDEAHKQIVRFLIGYLAGHIENNPMTTDKLNKIIKMINKIFKLNVKLLVD